MVRGRKTQRNITVIVLAVALLAVGFFAYRYFFATVSVLDYIQIKGVHIGTVEHDWIQGPFGSSIWGCRTSWNQDIERGVGDTKFPENEYKIDTDTKTKLWFFDPEDPIRCAPNLGIIVQYIGSERLYGEVTRLKYKVITIVSGSDVLGGLPAAEKENYYKDTYFYLSVEPPYVIEYYQLDEQVRYPLYNKTGEERLMVTVPYQAPGDNPLLISIATAVNPIISWIFHATGGKGITREYSLQVVVDLGRYVGTAPTTLRVTEPLQTGGVPGVYPGTYTQYVTLTVFKPATTTIYVTEFIHKYTTVTAGSTYTTWRTITQTYEVKVSGYVTVKETVTVKGTETITTTVAVVSTVQTGIGNIEELIKIAIIAGVILMVLAVAVVGIRAFRPSAQTGVRGGRGARRR